jgi:glycosyltransferase involved in cell wall biosynthesis
MRKILYIIGTLDIGGAERHLVEVVKHIDKSRFSPYVCTLVDGGALRSEIENAGIPLYSVDFRGLRSKYDPFSLWNLLKKLIRLYHFMREQQFAIVHGYLFWAYVFGAFAGRAARVPTIIASRRSLGNFKANKRHYLFIERIANRLTDLLIVNSHAVKNDVVRQEKVAPTKIRVIHNGIDLKPFAKLVDIAAKKQEFKIAPEAPLIGVIANYIHYKGHRYMIDALAQVRTIFPNVRCLLIGEGPMRPAIEAWIRERDLAENIILTGTRKDIAELIAAFDISVLPSLEEGFSNTILESMAAGKPVIVTAVGGNPEAVDDGKTGILVPPRDPEALAGALLELLRNPERARALGRAARERVEREFGIGRMIERMEDIYTRLMEAKG